MPKNDIDSVIALILRLPFSEHWDFMFRQFLILVQISRFNDMEAISVLLAAIKDKHRNFAIQVIDHCFEQVLRGIEENDFKDA